MVYTFGMLFFFGRPGSYEVTRAKRGMGSGLLSFSLLSLAFGAAIIAMPELLAYIVAGFFIITGLSLLSVWWTLRR